MSDLSTTYIGLHLPTPLLVASSGLSGTIDSLRRMADVGAGAVVLKSLFEEQLSAELAQTPEEAWLVAHAESADLMANFQMELGPDSYLRLIAEAKRALPVPVIASLNCVNPRWWTAYAKRIEEAGADALELNMALLPSDTRRTGADVEAVYLRILDEVRAAVRLPLAVKLGEQFTSLAHFGSQLQFHGAAALVLFNRFYRIDIDPDKLALRTGRRLPEAGDIHSALRWISLLAGRVECDLAASGGVGCGADAAKLLLAGANVVQVCSALYRHGIDHLAVIRRELLSWMESKRFGGIGDFRGRLRQLGSPQPEAYERLQYIKALVGIE